MLGLLLLAPKLIFAVLLKQGQENIGLPWHTVNKVHYGAIAKFVPNGYTILDQADGDLNGDGLNDKVLILKQKQEITEEEKRPVLILLGQKNGTYKLLAKNNNVVLSLGDGGIHGDPYDGVWVKKGSFTIGHFGGSSWRWSQAITFKFDPKEQGFVLYRIKNETWHMDRRTNFTSNIETPKNFGLVLFTNYFNKWRDKN